MITVVVAGVLGTIMMDFLNYLFAGIGLVTKIDMGTIGRMAMGWVRGRFFYPHPDEMEQFANEKFYGYITHYLIGLGLAFLYVMGWDLLIGGPASPIWAFLYGIATTAVSWFFVYPSMGFGILGMRSPEGLRAPLSSLANHLFYGVGLAVGIGIA
jgi:hypothetical protein